MRISPNHVSMDEMTEKYWEVRQPPSVATPEGALRLAILKQATKDYQYGATRALKALPQTHRSAFLSAKRWLEDADETHSFSFRSIVRELLKADPERVRRLIMMGSKRASLSSPG